MEAESARLEAKFHEHMRENHLQEARNVLEKSRSLAEAMASAPALEAVIRGHLDLGDTETVKTDLLPSTRLVELSEDILTKLFEMECISEEQIASTRFDKAIAAARLAIESSKFEEALQHFDQALVVKPDDSAAWNNRGNVLGSLDRYAEALASYDHALALMPNDATVWCNRGDVLCDLGQYEEALASYDRALALAPDNASTWYNRGIVCLNLFTNQGRQVGFDAARHYWKEALVSGKRSAHKGWPNLVLEILLEIIKSGQLVIVRQLIAEADLEEQFFPLARAIDYLQTGDAALVEKLSPEVKGIVEEVAETLRTVTKDATVPQA